MDTRSLAVPAVLALAAVALVTAVGVTPAGSHGDARAKLRGPDGSVAGTVLFQLEDGHTDVRLRLRRAPTADTALDAFHGFHIHANDVADNLAGCVADPTDPATAWFVSADGHWKAGSQTHGHHLGDLPSVLVLPDGTAEVRFRTDRFDLDELAGKAVVLHAGPDNLGNVPPDQYGPLTPTAVDTTARTGNAGNRIACGVIER